jgi:hypothetical protein
MPDITMCEDTDCPSARQCYRHMAVPNEFRQSYFSGRVRDYIGTCQYLMTVRPGDRLRPDRQPGKLHLRVVL